MTKAHDTYARRWYVSGRVQGVFFRASTRDQARACGLSGYALNRPDGRVEVLAVGSAGALDALGDWLQRGPPMARVDAVQAQDERVPEPAPGDFRVG